MERYLPTDNQMVRSNGHLEQVLVLPLRYRMGNECPALKPGPSTLSPLTPSLLLGTMLVRSQEQLQLLRSGVNQWMRDPPLSLCPFGPSLLLFLFPNRYKYKTSKLQHRIAASFRYHRAPLNNTSSPCSSNGYFNI